MRFIALALLFCAPLGAQSLIFLIDNSDGATPSSQLPVLSSPYTFPDTPVGGSSNIVIRVWNPSTTSVVLGPVFVRVAADSSSIANSNFTITGLYQGATIAPQAWTPFTLSFTPQGVGPPPGYLQALENSTVASIAILQGTATAAQLTLSCSGAPIQCNGNGLQPNSPTPLDFGNISTIGTSLVTFTLHNLTSATVSRPDVALTSELSASSSAFTLDTSTLPSTIDPNSSANFTVTFAPAEGGPPQGPVPFQGTLAVCLNLAGCPNNGNLNDHSNYNNYQLAGAGLGSVLGDISSLVISCVDQTGVDCSLQGRSISLGQIASGTNGTTLTFQVTNPQTTINAVTIPNLTPPSGFSLSSTWVGLPSCPAAPLMPATLQPNQCISFQLVFSSSVAGPYSGTLAIGARQFQIVGTVPQAVSLKLMCGAKECAQTFTSEQQVQATLGVDPSAPAPPLVTLALSFAPATGTRPDPFVTFISPVNSPNIGPITVGQGTQNGTPFTFQTGTTAGTITITPTYLGQSGTPWILTIPPAQVLITSTKAVRQDPNLVITLNGYDNTYSIGQLTFTFYDTSGRVIPSIPYQASVVATDFHQYFFGPEDLGVNGGGGFSVQATFPMATGNVTQVGSVAVTVTNSAGSTTTPNQAFQ